MLPTIDAWVHFADCYLEALDQIARGTAATGRTRGTQRPTPKERAATLAAWHQMLADRLEDSGDGDRLDALAAHPALGGPELDFFQAKLAQRRGDMAKARGLVVQFRGPGQEGFDERREVADGYLTPLAFPDIDVTLTDILGS